MTAMQTVRRYGRHSKGERDDFLQKKFLDGMTLDDLRERVVHKQITGDRTVYCVSSFSVSGGYYFVSAIKDIISGCNCQYYMYSHRPCRHMYLLHTVYKDNADSSLRIIHDVLDRAHDRHAVVQVQQNEVEDGRISPHMDDAVLEDEDAELEGRALELLEILKK
ncbi:hypothetical protein BGX20_006381, partial [Mortierella sp. AD010]